jgi:hypothetical protein
MRITDVALALSGEARKLLLELHRRSAVTVPRLNNGGLELMQHRLAGAEPDKIGHRLYLSQRGRSVAASITGTSESVG